MTIEIRQLVIRAVVEERAPALPGGSGTRPARESGAAAPATAGAVPEDQQALVDACVRAVLRQLDRSRER